jgi:hypothetical protein
MCAKRPEDDAEQHQQRAGDDATQGKSSISGWSGRHYSTWRSGLNDAAYVTGPLCDAL